MRKDRVIIGTRGSRLALTQTKIVQSKLRQYCPELVVETLIIKTKGDIIQDTPLAKIGDNGLFTKEIEQALLRGEIDLAVHSMKDLPTELPDGLQIGAILQREDPRDAFISKKFNRFSDLPRGATIATSSLRRRVNILMHRPDLQLVDIRGNVDTRLQKLVLKNYDGIILAVAGLLRLGYESEIVEMLEPDHFLPAVAQGALGIEIRKNDAQIAELATSLHHKPTGIAVTAERAFLRRLGGGCQVPIGAFAQAENGWLQLDGLISDPDGKLYFRGAISGNTAEAEQLGNQLAEQLLQQGAQKILYEIYRD